MDLEKGAYRFYTYLTDQYASEPFIKTITSLVDVEVAHARMLYQHLDPDVKNGDNFEKMFEKLDGDILEGGENLANVIQNVDQLEGNFCINLL